jgi:nitroreductase
MELVQSIKGRKSIRGYRPDPVAKEILTEILDLARLSPSGVNAQPWEFVVLTGQSLERAKQVNIKLLTTGADIDPDVPDYKLTGIYRERQVGVAKHLFRLMEIGREDKEKRQEWFMKGMRFYDAPAAIVICTDKEVFDRDLNPMCLVDVGIVTQTIALLAVERDLGTCIQAQIAYYPAALREAVGLPASKAIVLGLCIGYPDWDFPANQIECGREALDHLVTWKE